MARVLVVYHSVTGHTEQMAMAIAHGARTIPGGEVVVKRVPPLAGSPALAPDSLGAKIPVADPLELATYDGLIFGAPVRLGAVCVEMQAFLDRTAPLWEEGALIGKVGSVFVTTANQHGGHETAITSFHHTLLYHGMVVVGLPFSEVGLSTMAEISGGSPFGSGTISAMDGLRQPTDNEFDLAEAQGRRVANIAVRLYG